MATPRQSPERMVFFTDAVVAIALTLLVLPLVDLIPENGAGDKISSLTLITQNQSLIWGFLLSFVVILRQWLGHHRLFDQVKATSTLLMWLNMVWVLDIALVPFPTKMVSSYPGNDRLTLGLYIGVLLINSALQTAMGLLIHRDHELAKDPEAITEEWRFGSIALTAAFALALIGALAFPNGSYYWLLFIAIPPYLTKFRYRKS